MNGSGNFSSSEWEICEIIPINLQINYDNGYQARYSNAITRINETMNEVKKEVFKAFPILAIFYTIPTLITSYADTCTNSNYNEHCSCGECIPSTGINDLQNYHHKNEANIIYRLAAIEKPENIFGTIAFIGHELCQDCEGTETNIVGELLGTTLANYRTCIVMDHVDDEATTAFHELLHMFGAMDHYGPAPKLNTAYLNIGLSTNRYSEFCTYGEYHKLDSVKFDVCNGCSKAISSFINQHI